MKITQPLRWIMIDESFVFSHIFQLFKLFHVCFSRWPGKPSSSEGKKGSILLLFFGWGNATKWPWYKSRSQILRYRKSPANGLRLHLVGSVGSYYFSKAGQWIYQASGIESQNDCTQIVCCITRSRQRHFNAIQINLSKNMVVQTCHTSRYVLPPCHVSQLNRCNQDQKYVHLKLSKKSNWRMGTSQRKVSSKLIPKSPCRIKNLWITRVPAANHQWADPLSNQNMCWPNHDVLLWRLRMKDSRLMKNKSWNRVNKWTKE